MTAHANDRFSSVAFFIALISVIGFVCLVFFLPHLESFWKDTHQALSATQLSLIRVSRALSQMWIALTLVTLLAATIVWRVVAARQLRKWNVSEAEC